MVVEDCIVSLSSWVLIIGYENNVCLKIRLMLCGVYEVLIEGALICINLC